MTDTNHPGCGFCAALAHNLFKPTGALRPARGAKLVLAALFSTAFLSATAATVLTPWTPIFKGIDYAMGTNTPGSGSFQNLQVVYLIRVDLTDPDIRFFPSPRCTGYSADYYESAGYTTTNFLRNNHVQVAINANNFHDPGTLDSPSYTSAEGTRFRVTGELICTGQVVSAQESPVDAATFRFTTNNQATFVPTNWPASPPPTTFTAVSGLYAVLVNGVNIGSNYLGSSDFVHQAQPRTAFGLSRDRRYLYMLTIDGRQGGYSNGALDWETAGWLLLAGAWDGANMDGGGSTCLGMQSSTGQPVELNHDSAAADPGTQRERTVGGHFGVYARPIPGMINNVSALPDDTSATITWTTLQPATSQVQYGTDLTLGSSTTPDPTLVTNHAALLSGLSPGTGYLFRVLSTVGTTPYASSNFSFVTTNYLTTNFIFDLTNTWTYSTANLDGVNWTATNYDDTAWDGSGPGLLWVDTRGFPNPNIPAPMNTLMPADQSTGYPFLTYYLRTHFTFTNDLSSVSLAVHDFLDDGAVFYLNGAELYRLRMPASPTVIYNATLASAYACGGDATCPDDFVLTGVTNLVVGDNVLAVEAHNYNPGSPDITFGMSLASMVPYVPQPSLNIAPSNGLVTLSWSQGGFTLQQASNLSGPWTGVPGPVVSSPFTTNISSAALYFRLKK